MNNYQITIVTPTYNRADKLERLYNSLLAQSYKDFIWLIMDDGSTDNTQEIVENLAAQNQIKIEYHKHENSKLFLTVYYSFQFIKTPYYMRVDSDDTLPSNSLETLYNQMLIIKNDPKIWSVVGRVNYSNKSELDSEFPENYTDYVFLMRNKTKVRGAHAGLFKTDKIDLSDINPEYFKGKGYVSNFIHMKSDDLYQTKFINDVVYTYHIDETDIDTLTKTKFNPKNAFGLAEYHYFYIKYHAKYFWSYPKPIIGNLYRYLNFSSLIPNNNFTENIKRIDNTKLQLLAILMYPLLKIK